jgi:hypothetical protein
MLKQLDQIEKRLERLKSLIHDEESNKLIITSDKEFDDPCIDPRYMNHSYTSEAAKRINSPPPLTVPKNKSTVTGLYKGNNLQAISKPSKNEELQRIKIEKQIMYEKERKKIIRSNDDTKIAISSLNQSLQKSKQAIATSEQREKERLKKLELEPYRSNFSPTEKFKTYNQPVQSNKSDFNNIDDYNPANDPAFDLYSRMYISQRYLPFEELEREIGDTEVLRLPAFFERTSNRLAELRENNFIVIAMISSKSEPLYTNYGKNKYIRMKITDFKFDIFLYLHEDAYSEYWRLKTGSIIAILNPEILDPHYRSNTKQSGSQHYSLKLKNSLTILEYARFRDFGTCLGLNGKKCSEIVNIAKGRYCVYHQEKRADKAASNRNEMGSNYRLYAPVDEKGNKQIMVVTEKDIMDRELIDSYANNKINGLAIENAQKNASVGQYISTEKHSTAVLMTDYSNPANKENMKTTTENQQKHFTSLKASYAFTNFDIVNKKAIVEQGKRHELDRDLFKQRIMNDPILKRRNEKQNNELTMKKRLKNEVIERKKELFAASKHDKSLRKAKSTIESIKKEREEVLKRADFVRTKKINTLKNALQISGNKIRKLDEKKVELSSDDDSDDDADDSNG